MEKKTKMKNCTLCQKRLKNGWTKNHCASCVKESKKPVKWVEENEFFGTENTKKFTPKKGRPILYDQKKSRVTFRLTPLALEWLKSKGGHNFIETLARTPNFSS